jgi:hypothetical protein
MHRAALGIEVSDLSNELEGNTFSVQLAIASQVDLNVIKAAI